MHELSICQGILQVLEQQAREQEFTQVKTVWLEIGALAAVELEAIRFSFELVMKHSLAEGARLEIIEQPGRALCQQCNKEVLVQSFVDNCPTCGGHRLQLTAGTEMRIKELEVE